MKTGLPKDGLVGMTLVELLVVVAIIGVLACMLFPVISAVQRNARSAACVSNLRQLGAGVFLYANDNNNLLPTGWISSTSNWMMSLVKPTDYIGNGQNALIPLRLQKKGAVFFCPENVRSASSPSTSGGTTCYGWNHYGLLNKKLGAARNPSKLCMISENACTGNNWPNLLVEGGGATIRMSATIHGTYSNVLYFDGHIEQISKLPALSDELFWKY